MPRGLHAADDLRGAANVDGLIKREGQDVEVLGFKWRGRYGCVWMNGMGFAMLKFHL